jgi:hypothetical protein
MNKLYELLPGEKIEFKIYKFPKFVFIVLFYFLIKSLIPFFLYTLILFLITGDFFSDIFLKYLPWYLIYLNFLILLTFVDWLNEELDLIVITNKRIISFIQESFFKRYSSAASLSQVQDVKGYISGIIDTILGIGKIEIQTAGEKIQFLLKDVKDPERVSKKINNVVYQYQAKKDNLKEKNYLADTKEFDTVKEIIKSHNFQVQEILKPKV